MLSAEDPVGILAKTDQLPTPMPGPAEPILLLIDRAQRQWHADSYFVVETEGNLQLQWFDAEPQMPLLGRLVLLVRPKKVLDEDFTQELWQLEE